MKIIDIDVFSFDGKDKDVKIDNRIPTGKGIEIDINTIAMNSTTYNLIVDFSWFKLM